MEVSKVKELRARFEKNLRDMIVQFEKDSECAIEGVDIRRAEFFAAPLGELASRLVAVNIKVTL